MAETFTSSTASSVLPQLDKYDAEVLRQVIREIVKDDSTLETKIAEELQKHPEK